MVGRFGLHGATSLLIRAQSTCWISQHVVTSTHTYAHVTDLSQRVVLEMDLCDLSYPEQPTCFASLVGGKPHLHLSASPLLRPPTRSRGLGQSLPNHTLSMDSSVSVFFPTSLSPTPSTPTLTLPSTHIHTRACVPAHIQGDWKRSQV